MTDPTFAPLSQATEGFEPVFVLQNTGTSEFAPSYSSVPYAGPEKLADTKSPAKHTACMFTRADGSLCRGPRAKGTQHCIGHLRSLAKQEASDESV